jgi:hypothetical protein
MRERAEMNLDPHPPRRGQTPKASAIASRSNEHEQRIKQTTNNALDVDFAARSVSETGWHTLTVS